MQDNAIVKVGCYPEAEQINTAKVCVGCRKAGR